MFAFKSAVLLGFLSVCARLVAAEPPACLLAAINTEPNPADLSSVCGDATKVEAQIQSLCSGSNVNAAMQAFASTCSAAGKTVPTALSASGSASATGTGSMTGTASPTVITASETLMYTSAYYDTSCSCTKTTAVSTAVAVLSTGFASVTNSGMIPTTALPSATSTLTGSAPSVRIGSCAALLVGVAAFFATL